jgi:hypothetical protein
MNKDKVQHSLSCSIFELLTKLKIQVFIMLAISMALNAQNNSDTTINTKTYSELMCNWKNPPKIYKPVQIIHQYMPEKINDVEAYLNEAELRGLGGFVVNVEGNVESSDPFLSYLIDEKSWKTLNQFVTMARQKHFRIWLYDEKGYPSGSAGQWVYEENPEFQISGVISQTEETKGGKGEMILDRGDVLSITAIPYYLGGLEFNKQVTLERNLNTRSVTWDLPEGDWKIIAFIHKKLDWQTMSGKPYVDLLNPLVTQKFINLTHQRYKEQLGTELFEQIDAIFTDEPAFAVNGAGGVNEGYPLVPWTNDLGEKFYEKYGYSIAGQLPKLFFETIEPFQQIRIDYWKLISRMLEDSYFKQIGDWCSENKIDFTGHIFGEEALARQMGTCGDMFGVLRHMQMPGVDRLYSTNTEDVTAEKTASSVAHLLGRDRVMSESGCHYEINRWKTPYDIWDIVNSGTHQYILGVNTIASYYKIDEISDSDRAMYQQYMGRLGSMLTGAKHIAPVLIHIPMTGIWANYQPKAERYWEYGPGFTSVGQTAGVIEIETQYGMLLRNMMDSQWGFDLIDDRGLLECTVDENKKISTENDEYATLLVFDVGFFESEIEERIEKIINEGGKVIIIQNNKNLLSPVFKKYKSKISIAENWSKVSQLLEFSIERDFKLKEKNNNIWYRHVENLNSDIYFIYNRSLKVQNIHLEIKENDNFKKMDPLTGKIDELNITKLQNLEIPSRRGLFLLRASSDYPPFCP